MSIRPERHHVILDLSLAEQWVVHHVMLDSVGLASGEPLAETPPRWVLRILAKLEADDFDFTPLELDHIAHECAKYTRGDDVPTAERKHAESVIGQIDELLDGEDVEAYSRP